MILICTDADAADLAGSLVRPCRRCKTRVVVAPAGRAAIARYPGLVLVVCIRCGVDAIAAGEPVGAAVERRA